MSTFIPRLTACVHCGQSTMRSVCLSLNGPRRPDLVDEILAGRFQRWPCPCGAVQSVDQAMLYVDFGLGHWVVMLPAQGEKGWARHEQEAVASWRQNMVVNAPPMMRRLSGQSTVRCVFGLAALREKLVAWRAGLNDTWLEVLKIELMRSGVGWSPTRRPRLIEAGDKLIFEVAGAHLQVDPGLLTRMQLEPLDWLSAHQAVSAGPYVDVGRLLMPGQSRLDSGTLPS
ncbi:MAG: hypothetical protein ACI9VR_004135 [Cognaticolwellia sp.]